MIEGFVEGRYEVNYYFIFFLFFYDFVIFFGLFVGFLLFYKGFVGKCGEYYCEDFVESKLNNGEDGYFFLFFNEMFNLVCFEC